MKSSVLIVALSALMAAANPVQVRDSGHDLIRRSTVPCKARSPQPEPSPEPQRLIGLADELHVDVVSEPSPTPKLVTGLNFKSEPKLLAWTSPPEPQPVPEPTPKIILWSSHTEPSPSPKLGWTEEPEPQPSPAPDKIVLGTSEAASKPSPSPSPSPKPSPASKPQPALHLQPHPQPSPSPSPASASASSAQPPAQGSPQGTTLSVNGALSVHPAAHAPDAVDSATASYTQTILDQHNLHRKNHSCGDLVWDNTLASYAQTIANTCKFAHVMDVGGGGYGQNLAAYGSTASNLSSIMLEAAIYGISESWYNAEMMNWPASQYGKPNPPAGVALDDWGHFSQLVWSSTTSVGCASVLCPAGKILSFPSWFMVCNYKKQGNVAGEYGANVKKPKGNAMIMVNL